MPSDFVFIDFVNFLAKFSLSEYIRPGKGPSMLEIRCYCSRHGHGGFGVKMLGRDYKYILEVPRESHR